jgi:hypothetical protein
MGVEKDPKNPEELDIYISPFIWNNSQIFLREL